MSRRVIFLDRDGTLNVDHGYVSRKADWQFLPGAPEGICMLRQAGYAVAIVTNQSAIAAGRCTRDDVERLHEFVAEQLAAQGAKVDAIAYCPHAATAGCDCRKPQTGLARQIEVQLGEPIDFRGSWTIGDKPSDMEFGQALGTRTILLQSRYWSPSELQLKPDDICGSLLEAVQVICSREHSA